MTDSPYMPLYVADYIGDTMHLTTEQHGAYLLLLMASWRHGGRLPNDPLKLARIAKVSPRRWHLVSPDVLEFFDEVDGMLVQKRLEREHQKVLSISEKRSAAGKAGADAKSLKKNEPAQANAQAKVKHRARVPEPIPYKDTSSLRSDAVADAPRPDDGHENAAMVNGTLSGPAGSIPDVVDVLFGRPVLGFVGKSIGKPEAQARNMVGRWRKDFGDDAAVLSALRRAQADRPGNLVEWMAGAARDAKRGQDHGKSRLDQSLDRKFTIIAETRDRLTGGIADVGERPADVAAIAHDSRAGRD